MRADINSIEVRPGLLELRDQFGGHGVEDVFRKVAAGDAGLIGSDDGRDPVLVQTLYGLRRSWEKTDPTGMIDVSQFFDEGSVPVDEDRRPSDLGGQCKANSPIPQTKLP